MTPTWLQRLIVWLLTPARPGYPGISLYQDTVMSQATLDLTPSAFADATIKKATITPIVNGIPQTPVDSTGAPVMNTAPFGAKITATETVTNALGFTSDPSDPSPEFVVPDPRPAKPAAPTVSVVGIVPDPAPAQ